MRISITVIWFIAIFILAGCHDNPVKSEEDPTIEQRDHYTFVVDKSRASQMENNSGEVSGNPFTLDNVWLSKANETKYLNIELTQEQGCKDSFSEKYEVIWSGVTITIYPPQIPLFVKLNTSGCSVLENNVTDTISIDLYDHFQHKETADKATFIVVNTSKENDMITIAQHNVTQLAE